ncbi:MAG: hypothetical protein AAGF75_01290, partial [Cyanobacteria bacterium P01_H01_bin.130]
MPQSSVSPASADAIAPMAYSSKTWIRAKRAIRCAPFLQRFYEALRDQSVPLLEIVGAAGVDAGYVQT